jgi:hypothetical protein
MLLIFYFWRFKIIYHYQVDIIWPYGTFNYSCSVIINGYLFCFAKVMELIKKPVEEIHPPLCNIGLVAAKTFCAEGGGGGKTPPR